GPEVRLAAEERRGRGEGEAELSLGAVCHDEAVAVVADVDLFEEAVVAFDGDVRLLALGGLDLDVAGGYAALELERQRRMEGALQHLEVHPGAALDAEPDLAVARSLPP